jgi:hypothetical protein
MRRQQRRRNAFHICQITTRTAEAWLLPGLAAIEAARARTRDAP